MHWVLPEQSHRAGVEALARALGIPTFLATLLCQRGLGAPADAELFLRPQLKSLSDPFLLPNLRAAVDRLLAAIDRKERVVLYGDYDVDGVTSLALFTRILRAYGLAPECFLPSRMEEGYGLSEEGVRRCLEKHRPQLLVAVDCGTSSTAEIAHLRSQGVEVLVFDHHEGKGHPAPAAIVVNPKLGDSFHYLCSAGLVFKAAHGLLKTRPLPGFDLRLYLDLVALGTVADLVPLTGENRILVKRGLAQLAHSNFAGVRALVEKAGVRPPLCAADIGFKLGPRMNAAGRLGVAQEALELLLTEDAEQARALAERLDEQNRERRAVEDGVLKAADEQIKSTFLPERDAAIVAGGPGWHPGVVGIVASRISKRYHRPSIVIGFDEMGVGKGSCRSIEGFSLVRALEACGEALEKHGGHEMAAGLTIRWEKMPAFQRLFGEYARSRLGEEQLQPRLRLHAEVPLREVGLSLLKHHQALEPFGMANVRPVFYARGVALAEEPRVMKDKHLRFQFRQAGASARAIWFGAAQEKLPRPPWDVAFTVESSEYEGCVRAEIHVCAIRASA